MKPCTWTLSKPLTRIFLVILFFQSVLTRQQDHINLDELDYLFSDSDCIEGSLASFETEWPTLKFVPLMESISAYEPPSSSIEVKQENTCVSSPLQDVTELARYNKVKHSYDLTDEKGPAHNRRFVINLKLGHEKYQAEGSSIKSAQREAACLALNSTSFEHPPLKQVKGKPNKGMKTSVQKLQEFVDKRVGATATYFFSEETKYKHDLINYYHSKPYSINRVTVRINDAEFSGEGLSAVAAKEAAAANALNNLKNLIGLCPFIDSEGGILSKLLGYDSDNTSPISLINEFGLKSNIKTSISLISEEGPAHIKRFVFKCSVGDFETFGEGSSKKSAQREAATKMVNILKKEASKSAESCKNAFKEGTKKRKKRSKNVTKSVKKPAYYEEDYSEAMPPEHTKLDPISRLYQLQQRTYGEEPAFRLIKEGGNGFSMEVTIGDISVVGSGPTKKDAKRKAAEGMLNKLGYLPKDTKSHLKVPEQKKREYFVFEEDKSFSSEKPILNRPIESASHGEKKPKENSKYNSGVSEHSKIQENSNQQSKSQGNGKHQKKSQENSKQQSKSQGKSVRPIKDFQNLAKQLGIKFQFYDFLNKNKQGYISLVSLTTNPAQLCYGEGDTVERSQEKAALSALQNLYKHQLNTISEILKKEKDVETEIFLVEKTIIDKYSINVEKE